MIQFDEHMFQVGWNHQLAYIPVEDPKSVENLIINKIFGQKSLDLRGYTPRKL